MLISTNARDRLFAELEELQDLNDVLEAELALARNEETVISLTDADLVILAPREISA